MPSEDLARWLIYAGIGLIAFGTIIWVLGRFMALGNLPGDVAYQGDNVRIYVPITTVIVVSIVLTLLLNLILRLFR